ncbi:SDR family oxidoreductase [Marmoricola sp. RAF53]|uniref:SDR family oxidoreductase n=1 Tax=Marmoricola sp. RAF53 TaxID=3233059 RepID=UPI003F956F67
MKLNGKVVAITGGARGIGEATAKALTAAGARVAVGDLDADLAARSAQGYGGLGLPLDVTSTESFAAFLDKVEAEYGRIDALVNNAGIMVIGKHLDTPLEGQLKQLDINLRGVILGVHEVAPRMIAAGGGQIVNIASLAGRIPAPGSAVYSATKAGVLALTEALDAELAEHGVRVAAVLPSFTNTGLIDGTTAPRLSPPIQPEQVAAAVVGLVAKHRPVATVPKSLAFSSLQWGLMPNRAKRWLGRRTGMDTMFTDFDHTARAAYDQRTTGD